MASSEERVRRYENLIKKQTGVSAVRPFRADGYVNLLTKYGTERDSTENYQFQQEGIVDDMTLATFYEGNGLFAKIIDAPAEEAIKHGFKIKDLKDEDLTEFYEDALDQLDWEETFMQALKWTRLFGGALAVMLIDDGRRLEEPVDWKHIRSIDDIVLYDRSVVECNYNWEYEPEDPFRTRGSMTGKPEYFRVSSKYGSFTVHESRCLMFRNGRLPEKNTCSRYEQWGIPEYLRLYRAIRDSEIAHGSAVKLLDRSVQPIYKMKDLAAELATEEGEERVMRRLETIDLARGLLNTITVDNEGEDYDFKSFSFTGVAEVVDSTCNYLSALTCIPQTTLFGRSPAGMNATGQGDLENWYNYLERLQADKVKGNLRYLLTIIFQAGVYTGEVDEVPKIKIEFNPLWSQTEEQKVALENQKATAAQTRANTANIYVTMQALDPSEVRKGLADSGEYDIETLLDDYTDEELEANDPKNNPQNQQGGDPMAAMMGGGVPGGMPGMPGGDEPGQGPTEAPEDGRSGMSGDPEKDASDTMAMLEGLAHKEPDSGMEDDPEKNAKETMAMMSEIAGKKKGEDTGMESDPTKNAKDTLDMLAQIARGGSAPKEDANRSGKHRLVTVHDLDAGRFLTDEELAEAIRKKEEPDVIENEEARKDMESEDFKSGGHILTSAELESAFKHYGEMNARDTMKKLETVYRSE